MIKIADTLTSHGSAKYSLGTRTTDKDGNEYIYLQGVASTVAYDWVSYGTVYISARLVNSVKGPIAAAQAATVANENGWYQIKGTGSAKTSNSSAVNLNCYTCGVTGAVTTESATTGSVIFGVISGQVNTGTATTKVYMNYPWIGSIS
jgi:hypothetical protein